MRNTKLAQIFENHVGNFCMEFIQENYDSIIHDPHFTNLTLLITASAESRLATIFSKYMVVEDPNDLAVLVEVGYYDPAFDTMPPMEGQKNLHVIHLDYFFKGDAITPQFYTGQTSLYQDDGDDMPQVFMLDVLKECISQQTASPTLNLDDYR